MNELTQILEEIELPQEYNMIYDFNILSIFEWFEQDFGMKIDKKIIMENLKLGQVIIKDEIINYDLETVLKLSGYDFFGVISNDDFEDLIENGSINMKDIIEGKILIGFINDFEEIILVTKSYSTSEAVYTLIN